MVWKSLKCLKNFTNFNFTCTNHLIFAIILIAVGGSLCFLVGAILLVVVSKQYFNDNQSEGLLLIGIGFFITTMCFITWKLTGNDNKEIFGKVTDPVQINSTI